MSLSLPLRMIRDSGILIVGRIASQLIALAAMPILTRLYTPDMFGVLSLFLAIAGLLSILFSMRYELAIILPKDDDQAVTLAVLTCLFGTFWSTITALILWTPLVEVIPQLKGNNTPYFLLLIPIASFGLMSWQSVTFLMTRWRCYWQISVLTLGMQITIAALAISLSKHEGSGLVIARSAGIIAIFILSLALLPKHSFTHLKRITLKQICTAAKTYNKFPRFSLPSAFLASFAREFIVLILTGLQSFTIAGLYGLVRTVMYAPVATIVSSFGQVYAKEASENLESPALQRLTTTLLMAVICIGGPGIMIFMEWSREIFSILFGYEWVDAGQYAAIIAPVILLMFMTGLINRLYEITGHQKLALGLQLAFDGSAMLLFWWMMIKGYPFTLSLTILTIIQACFHVTSLFCIFHVTKFPITDLFKILGMGIAIITAFGLAFLPIRYFIDDQLWTFIAQFGVYGVYSCILGSIWLKTYLTAQRMEQAP